MMPVQFLLGPDGERAFAVLPVSEYERLVASGGDAADAQAAAETEGDEDLPWAMARRLIMGENPIRVWREHRGRTPDQLAEAAGVAPEALRRIESGEAEPTLPQARRLAVALGVGLDDLVAPDR